MAKKEKKKDIGGVLIPAGLLLGVGIGMIFNATGAGAVIGLGAGFLGMFIYSAKKKK